MSDKDDNPLKQLVEDINKDTLEADLVEFLEKNKFPQEKVARTL